jgi:hypothetical protein
MYEYIGSELVPEGYKEKERQHPRAVHVVSKKHVLACSVNLGGGDQNEKQKPTMTKTVTADQKLSPSDEKTHAIASKFQGLTVSAPTASQTISGEEAPQPHAGGQLHKLTQPRRLQKLILPWLLHMHNGDASFGE